MAEFFAEYGLFLLKTVTILVAVVLAATGIFAASQKNSGTEEGQIEVSSINEQFKHMGDSVTHAVMTPEQQKAQAKAEKKQAKKDKAARKKAAKAGADTDQAEADGKRRLYVLDFDGDIKAAAVENMRQEISAILAAARAGDEVLVKLESGGGMVHAYGLGASQLQRIKDKGLQLTICVDKVAASGGYMMACLADRIVAAPFALIGSIGVVGQLPNFHRLLKKNDIDFEIFTAGEYKRTLTMFGENTDKAREKFSEDLADIHVSFKSHIQRFRPDLNIDSVATGEVWLGEKALELGLIDQLGTSDQYLQDACNDADVYQVKHTEKKSLQEKLGLAVSSGISQALERSLTLLQNSRFR